MSERKNNSWSGTAFVSAEVKSREAGGHTIASSRISALSRKKERKFFIDIEAWDEGADQLLEAGQGARINVLDGYFTTEEWDDKTTGERRFKNVLTITEFEVVSTDSGGGQKVQRPASRPAPQGKGGKQPYQKSSYGGPKSNVGGRTPQNRNQEAVEDDIPF